MSSAEILIAKVDGYMLGVQHGKTMAEVDMYYKELLQEVEELQKMLSVDRGPSSVLKYKKQRTINAKQKR